MSRGKPIEMIDGKPVSVVRDNFIFDVKRLEKDGADWLARCPHCREQVCVDGGEGDPRGEQYTHKVPTCGGMFAIDSEARLVL